MALVKEGLEREVIPGLSGEPKYMGRMAAAGLGIALRQLHDRGATDEVIAGILRQVAGRRALVAEAPDPARALSRTIRAGAYDPPARLAALLADLGRVNEFDLSVSRGMSPQAKAHGS